MTIVNYDTPSYNKQVGICLTIVISQKRCLLKPFIHMRMNIQ